MKLVSKLCLVFTAAGLWLLLLSQSVQAGGFPPLPELGKSMPSAAVHVVEVSPVFSKISSISSADIASNQDYFSHPESFNSSETDAIYSDTNAIYRVVMANPLNSSAWNNLGYQLFSFSHYMEALAAYNHALLIDPDYSLSLANRCAVLSKMGEYAQALESCQRAIAKDHRWGNQGPALAWDNQGDVLFNLQLYQEALKSFEQAIALNPDDLNARRNWLVVQHQLNEISKENTLEDSQRDDDV